MKHRHCYEVLREGQRCHLYFDLEFARALNAEFDGAAAVLTLLEIVRALVGCVATALLARCGKWIHAATSRACGAQMLASLPARSPALQRYCDAIHICRALWGAQITDADVLESDSSTDAKWSRHLTVRMPGRAFASSVAVGVFVKDHVLRHPLAAQLQVAAETTGGHSVQTSMVDDAVYTKCAPDSSPHQIAALHNLAL